MCSFARLMQSFLQWKRQNVAVKFSISIFFEGYTAREIGEHLELQLK